ncbi:MAG: hypothetical protein J2P16_09995 [Mycobacterium sp.]|nr:hypothetical protein [Mycobacterium sp.]
MHGASWLLIVLAFVLGLVMTFALMIRRVEPEVPASSSVAAPESASAEPELPTDTPTADAEKDSS